MGAFEFYLIGINVVGFLLFLSLHKKGNLINILFTIISIIGGSLGTLLAILIYDRKAEKENMLSRVIIPCSFVIQIVALLYFYGFHSDSLNFAFWSFFAQNKYLLIYLGAINLITFIAFAVDKFNAVKDKTRIKITTLLGLSFFGGSLGGLLGMYILRHKTKKNYFTIGIPIMIIMQLAVLFFAMNARF